MVKIRKRDLEYFGYSSEIKPTVYNPEGTVFTEIDTGKKWFWYDGVWHKDKTLIYAFSEALKLQL